MNEAFKMLLDKLNPHAGHILVIGRGDARVLILGTPNAGNRLSFINQASPLEHEVVALETEHYRAIERDLVARFRAYTDDALGHWTNAEYQDVVAALNDYDLDTGARVHSGNIKLGDRIYVKGLGKGECGGFVTIASPTGAKERVTFHSEAIGWVHVPRSMVKPLLRAGQ